MDEEVSQEEARLALNLYASREWLVEVTARDVSQEL